MGPSPGNPILVTGAHRSGTTWVGKMLALAPGVGYVHEPFSPLTAPGVFDRFFETVGDENAHWYEPYLARTLAFRYRLPRRPRSAREAARAAQDWAAFTRARVTRARPLVKDPIALFSAEWLATRFGMDVVVTIRHPAAFASSLKRLGWTHDFRGWVGEPRLAAFDAEIREQAAAPGDVLAQAILLWRICYRLVDDYLRAHPDWIFVRHEDLSRDPVPGFERLFERLGLELTPGARTEIERSSAATNPPEAASQHDVRVDSRANLAGWRSRLSAEEIERVREGTRDVWPLFYADEDW